MSAKKITHLEDLTPDPRNANRGTQRGATLLETSLRKYGAGRSILADRDGVVIAGNKTLEQAAALGLDIQTVHSDGTKLVVVVRDDLTMNDTAAKELGIADNRVSEVSLEWEPAVLEELGGEIDLSAFFFDEELQTILDGDATITEGLTDPDDVPDVPAEPTTKPGDLWLLGRHRLLCGDSTVVTDVERLLNKAKPNLMITDPPYGVEYDPEWRHEAAERGVIGFSAKRLGKVANDDRADWSDAWNLFPGNVFYCWHASWYIGEVQQSLTDNGFEIRSLIIWAKDSFSISRGHYHWQHEPCWYAVRNGATAEWIGDRSQSTIWKINKQDGQDTGAHGTQKPVECMERPLRNHSGDVYDPFLGSGTTLIAAERQNRTCYGMEISPAYCDVIVRRWEQFTGGTATLEAVT